MGKKNGDKTEVLEVSKPRYRWWGFIRNVIRDYPILKRDLDELRSQSVTANLSGMPRGGGSGRTIEAVALRCLPADDQKMYDAVARAIEMTRLRPDGKERLDLITMMYWSPRPITAKSSALLLHISERTAKRWHGNFVRLVGFCYGFEVGTPEPK